MSTERFTVTDQEIKLIKGMRVSWWGCEFGAPAIDCKRPYGNSNVFKDMADMLGFLDDLENVDKYNSDEAEETYIEQVIEEQEEVLLQLHSNTQTVLQILIDNLSLEVGTYQRRKYGGKWTKIQSII